MTFLGMESLSKADEVGGSLNETISPRSTDRDCAAFLKTRLLWKIAGGTALLLLCILFIILAPFFKDSYLLGVVVAALFFLGVVCYGLYLYFREEKIKTERRFVEIVLSQVSEKSYAGKREALLAKAKALWKAKDMLDQLPAQVAHALIKSDSARLFARKMFRILLAKDLEELTETFFLSSIEQHIELVKLEPTSSESHAALANAYLALAHYFNEQKKKPYRLINMIHRWTIFSKIDSGSELEKKYYQALELACEELKIVSAYCPQEVWPHAQLARCYKRLGLLHEEAQEFEKILAIDPNDCSALCQLGILYFELGRASDGLKIYEKLSLISPEEGQKMLASYTSFSQLAISGVS